MFNINFTFLTPSKYGNINEFNMLIKLGCGSKQINHLIQIFLLDWRRNGS